MDPSIHNHYINNVLLTLVSLILLISLRMIINKAISKKKNLSLNERRKWLVRTRNTAFIFFVVLLYAIWANEIQTFAFSFAAIAAAIAIATKEFILSFCGTIMRTISQSFDHGDRIEIDGIRGDVVDQSPLSTTILEIGPGELTHQYTGRSIVIPNMLFLIHPLKNESFFKNFVLHTFLVPAKLKSWQKNKDFLLKACQLECKKYLEASQTSMDKKTKRKQLQSISVEARVTVKIHRPEEVNLIARVAVPVDLKGKIEDQIICKYLELLEKS